MPDSLTDQLERLAPTVDVAASRDLFERRRRQPSVPRWLAPAAAIALVVAGVVGLWWLSRSTGDVPAPATPTGTTTSGTTSGTTGAAIVPAEGETVLVDTDRFDVVAVSETTTGFGLAAIADSPESLATVWREWTLDGAPPEIAFGSDIALVMTRPDDACADTLVRFEVESVDGVPQWTPVFEDLAASCNEPLLSWLHVVTVPRELLADPVVFRIPGSETYGVVEQRLTYSAGDAERPAASTESATGVVVDLAPLGAPALHNTSVGLIWVVQHDDGTVSVLPATIERRSDDGLAPPLRSLVRASTSGRSFGADGAVWDEYGRSVTGPRSDDLAGFIGRVDGSSVEVWTSGLAPIDGEAVEPPAGEVYPLPDLGEPITPEQFFTLSSSGPIWRYLDAALVVENGVGRICQVEAQAVAVGRATCDDATAVLDTQLRSSGTSTGTAETIWFDGPILAFQDPFRGFTTVVPLGAAETLATVPDLGDAWSLRRAEVVCFAGRPGATVDVHVPGPLDFEVVAVEAGEILGRGQMTVLERGGVEITFDIARVPGSTAEVVLTSEGADVYRSPLVVPDGLDC